MNQLNGSKVSQASSLPFKELICVTDPLIDSTRMSCPTFHKKMVTESRQRQAADGLNGPTLQIYETGKPTRAVICRRFKENVSHKSPPGVDTFAEAANQRRPRQ